MCFASRPTTDNRTLVCCHNVTVTATLAYRQRYVHHSMGHVELDSKSPFVRLINQSHRMSNNPCKV